MIALHAWRSADSIVRFRELYPKRPLVVALTGTDIYQFQATDPETTRRSMAAADALVCLHDLVGEAIPPEHAAKLHVIHQSAPPLGRQRRPSKRTFDVCVIGHLRQVKDPLRAAYAVRDLAPESRLRVIHLGKAHNDAWADEALAETTRNSRYLWRGEVPGWAVRREFQKTHAMVLSSRMEGGANVVTEAVVAGVPVIASDIHGNVGLLGRSYPGLYPVADTAALRAMLLRAENEPAFLASLARHADRLAPRFAPERERRAWRRLLARLV
jgi:putative glycosyltransferase (TIGR04348 family)